LVGAGVVQPPYTASQGTAMGRSGRPRITADSDGSIWVGGATRTIVEGRVDVD
jgi:predicted PhzF superfamily epimerase YddE/YHI9